MNFINRESVFPSILVVSVGPATKGLEFESFLCSALIYKRLGCQIWGLYQGTYILFKDSIFDTKRKSIYPFNLSSAFGYFVLCFPFSLYPETNSLDLIVS